MAKLAFGEGPPVSRHLGRDLERLARSFHYEESLKVDPLNFVMPFRRDKKASEIMGIIASTVAVGNVLTIRNDITTLLAKMNGDPRGFVEGFKEVNWRTQFGMWKHRWIRGEQMAFLLVRMKEIYSNYGGGLEEVFTSGLGGEAPTPDNFAKGLDAISNALRWGSTDQRHTFYEPPPDYLKLFPTPMADSSPVCKRLNLFLRWMVRTERPDLGLWRLVSPSVLHIPLDTHVYWISYHMGLTRRKTRNWKTVVEITTKLREYDPIDPIRFDFALAHTGISGDCPKRADISVCKPCALRPDCDMWRRG